MLTLTFPPDILPVAAICPVVLRFPGVMFPVTSKPVFTTASPDEPIMAITLVTTPPSFTRNTISPSCVSLSILTSLPLTLI